MTEDPDGPSPRLWPALVGFLVFCLAVGLLFGLLAYRLIQEVFGAMAA
jgi:hypothetical protein